MPTYDKFMKELLKKKNTYIEQDTIQLEPGCNVIIQKSLPFKNKDPGSFTIPCSIGNLSVGKALLDWRASISLIPLLMLSKVGYVEIKPTRMTHQLANRLIKVPYGVVEDVLVKVDKFVSWIKNLEGWEINSSTF